MKNLETIWSKAAALGQTLKEYPRPDMVRRHWINLNGMWDYLITDSRILPWQFYESEYFPFDGQILVPFSPEAPLSQVKRQLLPDETLWYSRTIQLPENCLNTESQRLLLHFGAVDQICSVYINRKFVTYHKGGYLPFTTDITDFITDIYCASKLKNNICFSVINEVNMENVDMYLKEILEYASSPNLKHTIKVNKQIDLTIPKNMLFIIVPKSNDFINKIPAKLSQYSTIIHLLMREEKKIPLNEDISCLSYSYLHSLVDDYKNDFYLSENNWKKIDSFISCLNLKENIELSNKCSLRIEDYVTTYMASGGDEFQALEAVGQEILLPYVSFLDYFKDNKNYSSFIELTNNCFGEEANEILRYFKIQEVSEV